MKLGFIGTGIISEAIITGLMRHEQPDLQLLVSARGREISARLAQQYAQVTVFEANQAILDEADAVVLAVRPQIAPEVLQALTFRPERPVISLIAGLSIERLKAWVKQPVDITRAIPLPFVSDGIGATPIFPESPVAHELFAQVGPVVVAKTIEEFDTYAAGSAWMGTYFGILREYSRWMQARGIAPEDARTYLSGLMMGLAQTTAKSGDDFETLRHGHTTVGGLNQRVYETFTAEGGMTALNRALDSVLALVQSGFR